MTKEDEAELNKILIDDRDNHIGIKAAIIAACAYKQKRITELEDDKQKLKSEAELLTQLFWVIREFVSHGATEETLGEIDKTCVEAINSEHKETEGCADIAESGEIDWSTMGDAVGTVKKGGADE